MQGPRAPHAWLATIVLLALAGCAARPGDPVATAPAHHLDPWSAPATAIPGPLPDGSALVWPHLIPVVTYDADTEERIGDPVAAGTRLAFPPVPGAIFGAASWRAGVATLGITADSRMALVLPERQALLAQPPRDAGLVIQPADVGVLRVGTFHQQPGDDDWEGGSFRARTSGAFLLLVWVSAPCTMQGSIGPADDLARVDVVLDRAGWHWLAAIPDGGDWRMTAWQGPAEDVEFGAIIERPTY